MACGIFPDQGSNLCPPLMARFFFKKTFYFVFVYSWLTCVCMYLHRYLHRYPCWQRICLRCRRPGFDPWDGKIPWRKERLPTPVFWPREFHGLYCISPWSHKESDMTFTGTHSLSYIDMYPFYPKLPPIQVATQHWAEIPVLFHRSCWLFILNVAKCTCQSQTSWLSLSHIFPLTPATLNFFSKAVSLFHK